MRAQDRAASGVFGRRGGPWLAMAAEDFKTVDGRRGVSGDLFFNAECGSLLGLSTSFLSNTMSCDRT